MLHGRELLYVPVTVILELEWVLRSRYGLAPKAVAHATEGIAALRNVVLGERAAVLAATTKAVKSWGFAAALHYALSHGCDAFITLDGDLPKRAGRVDSRVAKAVPAVIKL